MLSRGRQSMCRRLWHTPKISQKFAGELKLVCSSTVVMKTALGIIQVWFNYFAASFFKALGNLNANYWNFPAYVAGRTKGPRGPHAARGPRVWDPCFRGTSRLRSAFIFLQCFKLAHMCIQVTSLHKCNKQGINHRFLSLAYFTWGVKLRESWA